MSLLKEEFKAATPFKNGEEVKAEIRECDRFATITRWACLICTTLGAIGDAWGITLGLMSISWSRAREIPSATRKKNVTKLNLLECVV